MDHHLEQRRMPVRILIGAGWVAGHLPLPARRTLGDHLEHVGGFLNLTDVNLPGWKQTLPFFALARGAITLIIPDETDALIEPPAPLLGVEPHTAVCLLEGTLLTGTVHALAGTRVSDYLAGHAGFFVMHDVVLRRQGPDGATEHRYPVVFVAAAHVIGVTDRPA